MVLVLSVLRCPDHAASEQRRVGGGEYVLGRSVDCDWPLQDPDRVLSKRHCVVEYLAGAWQARDISTNGTFVNSASEPLGRDRAHVLRNGDRLRLGAYEIECQVEEEAGFGGGHWRPPAGLLDSNAAAEPSDIFSAPLPGLSPAGSSPDGHAPLLPTDFNPFADEDADPVMPDHRPSTNDVFTPPRARTPDLLPDDWDAPLVPATGPGAPPPASIPPDTGDPFAEAFAEMPPPPARATFAPAAPSPASGDLHAALAIVFRAAGLAPPPDTLDPEVALASAGTGLRAAVAGLRALLIARADVKREFRIEQTMLRAAGNNPVKFAATDEAAVLSLLSQSNSAAALGETVQDLTAHQVATLAATQAAARALLARLAPAPLEAGTPGGGIMPGAREKRLWEAYRRLHQQVMDQFEDDFDSAFGKAFARAYEEAARSGR